MTTSAFCDRRYCVRPLLCMWQDYNKDNLLVWWKLHLWLQYVNLSIRSCSPSWRLSRGVCQGEPPNKSRVYRGTYRYRDAVVIERHQQYPEAFKYSLQDRQYMCNRPKGRANWHGMLRHTIMTPRHQDSIYIPNVTWRRRYTDVILRKFWKLSFCQPSSTAVIRSPKYNRETSSLSHQVNTIFIGILSLSK